MSEQTSMEPRAQRRLEDQTYTVMVREEQKAMDEGVVLETEVEYVWVDVATVTVPGRTQRKTVIEKALSEAGMVPPVGEQFEVRVLDADSSRGVPVGSVQPPPQLQIGEAA